jgi:hypothetical protein
MVAVAQLVDGLVLCGMKTQVDLQVRACRCCSTCM